MGRKFKRSGRSSGRRDQGGNKTLKCLKCNERFALSEFVNHVKECKASSNDVKPSS